MEGYVAVKLRVPGKNYVVCCGFNVGLNRCNAAGLQIRAEDGAKDGYGNIAGHGVDPTGKVADISKLANQVKYGGYGGGNEHIFNEETRSFKVICKFNNKYLGKHHFIFKNGVEESK